MLTDPLLSQPALAAAGQTLRDGERETVSRMSYWFRLHQRDAGPMSPAGLAFGELADRLDMVASPVSLQSATMASTQEG